VKKKEKTLSNWVDHCPIYIAKFCDKFFSLCLHFNRKIVDSWIFSSTMVAISPVIPVYEQMDAFDRYFFIGFLSSTENFYDRKKSSFRIG